MTREEAIEAIKETYGNSEYTDEIIKALEQEPRKDEVILTKEEYGELVSSEFDNGYAKGYREALEQEPTTKNDLGVASGLEKNSQKLEKNFGELDCISRADARKAIIAHQYSDSFCEEHSIDHSINTGMALIALSDLPSVTPQLCEDVVSRQAVLDLIADYDLSMGQVVRGIHALSSVTPQEPKTGHWILTDVQGSRVWFCNCSKCNKDPLDFVGGSENWWLIKSKLPKFCPNCGSRNEVEE